MSSVERLGAWTLRVMAFALVTASVLSFPNHSLAQSRSRALSEWSDDGRRDTESPERFLLEFGGGPYTPNTVPAFQQAFDTIFDDVGPNLRLEFSGVIWRIPWVGLVGAGVGIGWMEFDAAGCRTTSCDERTSDEIKLALVPLSAFGFLRVDVLAREFKVPLVFTGKLGYEAIYYNISNAGESEDQGFASGLRWAAQAALELDFLQPRAARALDDEWGINHTFLFFELYGSTARSTPPVGSNLAFWFGLGLNL